MWQAGTLDRLRTKWFGHGSHMCGAELASVRALTLADLLAVLVITPLAAAVSCLLLAVELLAHRRRRNPSRVDRGGRTNAWSVPGELAAGERDTVRML